jgi:ferredoxin
MIGENCLSCGVCTGKCPFGAVAKTTETVYQIYFGGTWGKKRRTGTPLSRMVSEDEIWQLLEQEANEGGDVSLEHLADIVDNPDTEKLIREALEHGYDISDALSDRIKERTNLIVNDYSRQTREQMRAVLNNSEQLTAKEIQERLEASIPSQRAATIARNETVYAFRSGRLEADGNIANQYGFAKDLRLIWRCTKDATTCDLCAAMDGQVTTLGQAYTDQIDVREGEELPNGHTVEESKTLAFRHDEWNDQGQIPSAHVNCRCYFDEELI